MIVIPAIDLKDGQVVRLKQGVMEDSTVYSDNPTEMARRLQEMGADYIHVVDLNGAIEGSPKNLEAVKAIVESVDLPVEVGGGIRDLETVKLYLNAGVARVIIGTKAVEDKAFLSELLDRFGDRVAVSLDANGDKLATRGWVEKSDVDVLDYAEELSGMGVATIIYTDISKDGMLTGPNFEMLEELAKRVDSDVVASGGVRDVGHLKRLEGMGLYGAITGRAVYEGTLDLEGFLKSRREQC